MTSLFKDMDVRGPTATEKPSATPSEKPVPGEDAAATCGCCYILSMIFCCLTG